MTCKERNTELVIERGINRNENGVMFLYYPIIPALVALSENFKRVPTIVGNYSSNVCI